MRKLGLFPVGYNLYFGVRHQPRQPSHVYVNLIPILQKLHILLDPERKRRDTHLNLVPRQIFTASLVLNRIRKQFLDIDMLGHGQKLHQDIGFPDTQAVGDINEKAKQMHKRKKAEIDKETGDEAGVHT